MGIAQLGRMVTAALKRLAARIGAYVDRDARDRDFHDEWASHVAMLTDDHIRRGMTPGEARRQALIRVGGLAAFADQHRDARGLPFLDTVRQDVSHARRLFRRSPGFFLGTVFTLALGVGVNGAVFGILRAVLLQPLPYRDPGRVVMVWTERAQPVANPFAIPRASRNTPTGNLATRAHTDTAALLETATLRSWKGNLEARFDIALDDRTEQLRGALATPNFFDVLGVSAAIGRVFTQGDAATAAPLLVISDALWRRDFAADPGVVGRAIRLTAGFPRREEIFTVIGVLPPAFRYTYPLETEAWTMLPWSRVTGDGVGFETVARLAGDVSLAAANARVAAMPMTAEASTGRPEDRLTLHFVLEPITKWVLDEARPSLWLLGGVAALLLLIACATVASALFVRVAERQQELALRAAIGAGRGRLVRQLLTEGALLSVVAAAMGSLLAALAAPLLRTVVPASVPRAADIGVNLWIIAFFAAAAGVATIAAALAPAWRGARFDVVSMLKGSTRGASADLTTARWRRTLVGLQCALCTALFLAAALLLVSFWRLSHMPLGFDGERVLAVELNPMADKYRVTHSAGSQTSSPGVLALQEQLSTRLRAVPGILDVGLTSAIPFNGFDFMRYFHPMGAPDQELPGNARFVDPGFFSVLDIPVVRGRLITANDTVGSPRVIVISEAFARRMFGSEDPIGKFVNPDEPLEVVGVVGDLRYRTFDSDPYPAVYLPINQSQTLSVCVVAKLSPGAGNLEPMIRSAIKAVDPQLPALSVKTLDEILSTSVAERRFYATSTTALASLALVLTVAGLVVVISRAVVERRREMAIRSALGANASALIGAVVRQGLAPVVIGIAGGLGAVFAAAAFLRQFLFHTAPSDVSLVAGVALTVLLVAIVAALIPARRAARVSPAAVLRAE